MNISRRQMLDPAARRGHRLEVCPGRHPGRLAQLQDDRALVGHADRHCQMHRLRQLRSRLQTENDVPDGFFRTWVERYHVTDWNMETRRSSRPTAARKDFPPSRKTDGKYFFVPKLCNHCADSPCTQVCPVGATFISPDGVVLVDQKYCLGCAYCVQACPYGCRYIHPEKKVADKCTLCYHRITKGLTTACCESLPHRRAATS